MKHYDISDGIPSATIYDIAQDQQGFLWIGTDDGLVCFDGTSFHTPHSDSFRNNQIIRFSWAPEGILAINLLGEVMIARDHQSVSRVWNTNVDSLPKKFRDACFDMHGNLLVATYYPTDQFARCYVLRAGDSVPTPFSIIPFSEIYENGKDMGGVSMVCWDRYEERLIILSMPGEYPGTSLISYVTFGATGSCLVQNIPFRQHQHKEPKWGIVKLFVSEGGIYGTNLFKTAFSLSRKTGKVQLLSFSGIPDDATLSSLISDEEGKLWVATSRGLHHCVRENDSTYRVEQSLLDNQVVHALCRDHEGNLWIGTESQGLYRLTPAIYQTLKTSDVGIGEAHFPVKQMATDRDGGIWAITRMGHLLRMNEETYKLAPCLPPGDYNGVKRNGQKQLLVMGDGGIPLQMLTPNGESWKKSAFETCQNIKQAAWFAGKWWVGSSYYTSWIDPLTSHIAHLDSFNRIGNIYADTTAGRVWVGRGDGLLYGHGDNTLKRFADARGKDVSHFVSAIERTDDSTLFIGTKGQGLWRIQHDTLRLVNSLYSLSAMSYRDFAFIPPHLWAITEEGVLKINLHTKQSQETDWDKNAELGELYDLAYDGRFLYLSAAEGISWRTPHQSQGTASPPMIRLLSFEAQNELGERKTDRSLPHDFRQVLIRFAGISYAESVTYEYRTNLRAEWIPIDEPILRLEFLPPGAYDILIRAVKKNGLRSDTPIRVFFQIQPPAWQTWWFRFLALLSLILAVGLSTFSWVRRRARKVQEATETEGKIASLRLHALRAQMNPHFIFNCLSVVQYSLLNNKGTSALEFLEDLAKMIRMGFDYAGWDYISLEQELSFLQTYIQLERERLTQPLHVQVDIDPRLSTTECHIPPMLIQPIVENAIQHGILTKEGDGELHIIIDHPVPLAGWLRCRITDNGVGRHSGDVSTNGYGKKHRPSGLTITQQRLDLIQRQTRETASLTIKDLTDSQNRPAGTQVELRIPYQFISQD